MAATELQREGEVFPPSRSAPVLSCISIPKLILQPEFKIHFPVIMQWEPSSCGIAQAARCENGTDFGEVRLACLPLTTVTLIKSLPSFTFCATPDNPRETTNRNAASAEPSEKLSRGRGRNPLRDPARVRRWRKKLSQRRSKQRLTDAEIQLRLAAERQFVRVALTR